MFSVQAYSPAWQQLRGMATLKDIALRLKSVKNIQKITKSMKIVSTAKFSRAEKELKEAKVYGAGSMALYDKVEFNTDKARNHLIVAITSDKGLCGAFHANIAKAVKSRVSELPEGTSFGIVCVGDKVKGQLQRVHRDKILMHLSEYGRNPPTFTEASFVAKEILSSGFEYDTGEIFYNKFKNMVSYKPTPQPVYSVDIVANSETMSIYDDLDADVLQNYQEYSLASLVYYAMKESTASELSARMTAMDGASKNAGEMIDKLTLTYNRTRQAVITRELIEIISGAAAV